MASKGLGTLTLSLIVQMGAFSAGMDKAARHADRRMRDIEKRAKQFGAILATGLAAAATGVAVALTQTINRMDELRDQSIRLGIGVETLSAFAFAAKQTGTDIEALGTGFKILAKNMADALNPKSGKAQIFEALGIEVEDATGKLKQFEQIIPEIADRFKELEDGTTKAALAQELFGKSGLNLVEFLNQGGDGIQTLIDRARELGLTFDQEAADKADEFKDTLAELKAVGEGLATQVAIQLLPALVDLAEWARDFAKEGANAIEIADKLRIGFEVLSTAAHIVSSAFEIVGAGLAGLAANGKAAYDILAGYATLDFGQIRRGLDLTKASASGLLDEIKEAFGVGQKVAAGAGLPDFSRVSGSFRSADSIDRGALNRALGGIKPDTDKKKKTGKSEEEKEAERLQQAYERMNESLAQQIALFGKDGEAARIRYEIEHGELAKLDAAKKQELISRAETLDLMRAEEEQMKKSMELAKQEAEEKLRGVESTDALIRDMRFELELLTMTNKERERAIALRYADKNATDEQRAEIARLSDAYYDARQAADFWMEAQNGIADALYDTVTGAKSAGDAIKDFFDNLAKYILRSISENWAERITQLLMGSGGGTSTSILNPITGQTQTSGGGGFDWMALASAFFGGGRASGGPVSAGMFYRVNENGPELLSVGGNDYLMMGNRSGMVSPQPAMAGAGFTQVNNINYAAPYDPKVERQKNARLAFEFNRDQSRNR